jgi:hypothetical protein
MEKSVIKVRFISFCLILLAFVLLGNKQVNAASGLGDTVQDQNSGLCGVITRLQNPQVPGDMGEVAVKGFTNFQEVLQRCQQQRTFATVNIPNEMTAWGNRYQVTRIASESFSRCSFIGRVIIPNTVTNIGDAAFLACTNLRQIEIPGSVIKIEDCAFKYCSSLTSVIFSEGLNEIGFSAFADCRSLSVITIPNSLRDIGRSAFFNTRVGDDIPFPTHINRYSIFQNPVTQQLGVLPFFRFP